MYHTDSPVESSNMYPATRRDRMLLYGFVASIIGVPIGIYLGLPVVWGLALVGIVIGGVKLALRRFGTSN
jgi:hypothetical protein